VKTRALLAAALLLAIGLAWAPGLDAPFTYDDRIEVVGNPAIRWLDDLGTIAEYNTSRPILILTYAVNWHFSGLDPRGYHLMSVAIHMVNALLAWRLGARLLPGPRAAFVAALWALHPMTTEAVTYITGRSDALEATWWFVGLTAWIDHRRGVSGARWVALAAAAAALATKEVGLLLPLAFVAVDRWAVPPRTGERARWRDHAPVFAAGALAVLVRLTVYGWPQPEVPREALAQLLSQAEVWARYLQLWTVPIGQSVLHDHPGVPRAAGAVALLVWLGGTAAVGWHARRAPAGSPPALRALALALWGAWLLPSSLLPLLESMAEHRAYFAGHALLLGLAASVHPLPGPRAALKAGALGLLAAAASLTFTRNRLWADEVALWEEAALRAPDSARAWYGWGEALRFARRFAEAEPAYRRAAALDPSDPDPVVNLGIVRAELGDAEEARALWQRVVDADPRTCSAHNNLGALALRQGRTPEAVRWYTASLARCEDDPIAHLSLAGIAYDRGQAREAAWHYRQYLQIAPMGPGAKIAEDRLRRLAVD
jgi:tetratricopeptide (TPR) repeat protein